MSGFGMINQLSPGVAYREIDLTGRVPAVATSSGATVGAFDWGPVQEVVTVNSEDTLRRMFGTPTDSNYKDWMVAANFLAYGNNLKVVRITDGAAINASDTGALAAPLNNFTVWDPAITYVDNFIAKFPGAKGNDFVVEVADSVSYGVGFSTLALGAVSYDLTKEFDYAPTGGEIAIVVIDTKAVKSGDTFIPQIVEKFILSTDPTAKDFQGQSNFVRDVIATKSNYIYCTKGFNALIDPAVTPFNGTYTLASGTDTIYANLIEADYEGASSTAGWQLFSDPEAIDISLCLQGGMPAGIALLVSKWVVQNIAEVRRDCVVFTSPLETDIVGKANSSDVVTAVRLSRNSFASSSYAFMDGNYKYQYDRYNDKYRWIPLNGDIAGLAAATDNIADPWFSPAGYNRGNIKNAVKLAFNPARTFRDELYQMQVNPVVNFTGQGIMLFGDKTMQQKPSAFDRINVRRLFIVLEKSISIASRYSLFELNDAFTRARFVQMVEPFLRNIQGRRGIYDFRVIADATNNTPVVIDSNNFVGDIYIKPARSINFISLNFVATPTGVAFTEIIG